MCGGYGSRALVPCNLIKFWNDVQRVASMVSVEDELTSPLG